MERNPSTTEEPTQGTPISGACAFCLGPIDLHRDRKDRLYWVCPRCSIRVFGMDRHLATLRDAGWIWTGERPLAALRAWLNQVAQSAGISAATRKP